MQAIVLGVSGAGDEPPPHPPPGQHLPLGKTFQLNANRVCRGALRIIIKF